MSRANVAAVVFLGVALSIIGCGGESADGRSGFRIEGTEAGDCEDNADNDADGLFDCADPSCEASPLRSATPVATQAPAESQAPVALVPELLG